MITGTALRRLADADPAGRLDPAVDEDLLARLLAEPRPAGPSARRPPARLLPRRPAIAVAMAAAVAAVVLAANPAGLVRSTGSGPLALAAQAYANTSAGPGAISHVRAAFELTRATMADDKGEVGTIEEWHRGDETHRIEKYYSANGDLTIASDHVIDADGVMRQITNDGSYRIVRASDNEDAADVIAKEQSGFVEEFRRHYERGELDPAGDVRFAGRPARRYVVTAEQNTPKTVVKDGQTVPASAAMPRGPEQAFYVDRETAQPLGYTSTMSSSDGPGRPTRTTIRYVETIEAIEQLAPTPEHLAALRTLSLPRRRDADGCIRGPITEARSRDTASKTDCGGTPGAVVAP